MREFNKEGKFEILTVPYSPYNLEEHPLVKEADIVHLHWTGQLVDLSFFKKIDKPVVWTLHDMNPFMGVFHYCCDHDQADIDLLKIDRSVLSEKFSAYNSLKKLAIVSPSKWLLDAAKQSGAFPNASFKCIANPMPFKEDLMEPESASNSDSAIVIAHNLSVKRKGMHLLNEALKQVQHPITVVAIGTGSLEVDNDKIRIQAEGQINDADQILNYYRQSDVLILPSIEDNLPNTMLESLSVGTPVIAFETGGMKEIIRPGFNGLLASDFSGRELAKTLDKFFKEKHQYDRNAIREDAKLQFEAAKQAAKYLEVYKTLTP